MKLESLKLDRFQKDALKKEQMFKLNGGGVATPAGNVCAPHGAEQTHVNFNYGYDAIRTRSDGTTYLTFHNRTDRVDNC